MTPATMSPADAVVRSCTSKSRFSDEPAARAVAMHMLQTGVIPTRRAWVYRCGECRGWHITSRGAGNHLSASVRADDPWVAPEFQA